MAGGASSSFSFTPSFFTYDVFLSFRGEDTRIGFTGHLYFALDQGGIFTFFDDREIGKGKKIRPLLVKAIEESRIAIVVLSKNYASSSFCLDELVNIMECVEKKKVRLVIPIFYDVDPSHVRKQRGTFGKALLAHKKKFKAASKTENFNDDMKRLKTWKEALRGVANLSGYHISKHGRVQECRLIEEIVYQVSRGIRRVALHFVYHPVGLDGRDDNVIRALYDNGGMDKTTLIKAAYDLIGNRLEDFSFEGICVFEKIIENSNNQRGLKHPQKIIWRLEYQGEAIDIGVKEIIDLKHKKFSRRYLNGLLSESERNHRVFRFSMKGRIPEIGTHAVRHESLDSLLMKGYSANSTAQIEMSSTTTNVQENERNHVECHFYPIHRPKRWKTKRCKTEVPKRRKTEVPKRWKIEVHVINHKSSMEDDIQFSDQEDHPPAENSLKDCVSNSVAQIGISSTTNNVQEYDQAVLYHPKKVPGESSRAAGFAKTQNTEAQRSILSSGKISGQELHLNTMLPTTIDESVRGHLEPSDDDAEMEAFYASLDADNYVLSHSHDHSARSVTSEKAKEALKILQDFFIKDPSFLVDPKQYTTFKSSLDYLSNLSASDDGFSGEMRALISEASRMFTHSSGDYIEASMKIESTSSELLKADELEAGMEDNRNQFKKIVALEKELLQKLVYLEESKKELEKQINAIEASISASQSEQSMTREKKRNIFNEGKTLKTQISEFRGKVTHLQHEQDVARETQAKITAEWLELGEKFQKVVVE